MQMFTGKVRGFSAKSLFSWQFLMIKILLLALVAVLVEKPTGVMGGRISVGQKGFGLHTYDIKANKVYVIAEGPRNGPSIERGVWVQDDGHFKFDHLPVGEYQIKVRAVGFETATVWFILGALTLALRRISCESRT